MMGKKDVASLPQKIYKSIQACEVDIRTVLANNIILSGGASCFDGLPARLDYEIEELADQWKKHRIPGKGGKDIVKVMSGKDMGIDCRNVVWQGAALIASSQIQKDKWMTAADYVEYGADHINTKVLAP